MARFSSALDSSFNQVSPRSLPGRGRARSAGARTVMACLVALAGVSTAFSTLALGCAGENLHGVSILPKRPAPEIAAEDTAGGTFSLGAQHGRVIVLSFGYTSCPDVCPTTLSKMKELHRRLGEARIGGVSSVFFSVDPERDTTARLREYVSAFDPRIMGVRLTGPALSSTLLAYGVTAERHDIPLDRYEGRPLEGAYYSVDHTAGYFVIDRAGDLRLRFAAEVSVDDLVSDVLALAAEGGKP